MAASIKRDAVKQSWEDSSETEFPLVCETCLGDNPYVRMTKEAHGKQCQVCETPFTVFKWQAGTKGRLKRVEICRNCARAKNVCQVCVYDLQYGLPVKVRDQVLRETAGAEGAGGVMTTAVPQSMANRSWFTAQQQRQLDQQGDNANAITNPVAHAQLMEMAQMEPRYERNLPKLCSFFAKGECDRGVSCPFRHEMPIHDKNSPMTKQSTKNRFYGGDSENDPVASKILARRNKRQREEEEANGDGDDHARATVYVRLQGDPPYHNILTETAIRDEFYACGEIVSVRVQPDQGQAFVEYSEPQGAQLALAKHRNCSIQNRLLQVKWARVPKRGDTSTSGGGNSSNNNNNNNRRENGNHGNNRRSGGGDFSTAAAAAGASANSSKQHTPGPTSVAVLPPPPAASSSANNKKHKPLPKGMVAVRPKLNFAPPIANNSRHNNSGRGVYPSANPDRLGTKGGE